MPPTLLTCVLVAFLALCALGFVAGYCWAISVVSDQITLLRQAEKRQHNEQCSYVRWIEVPNNRFTRAVAKNGLCAKIVIATAPIAVAVWAISELLSFVWMCIEDAFYSLREARGDN